MRIQTKLTVLLLTLPLAYAATTETKTLTGTVAEINSIATALTGTGSIFSGGSDNGETITITVSNNDPDGYVLHAHSSHGGDLKHSNNSAAEAYNVSYDLTCAVNANAGITAGPNLIPGVEASKTKIWAHNGTGGPVSDEDIVCTFALASDETLADHYVGDYDDAITITITNL